MDVLELPADANGIEAFLMRYRQLEHLEAGWRDHAACSSPQVPPLRFFFPDTSSATSSAAKVRRARRICAGCPVRRPCLSLALAEGLEGVWAGTTDEQRHASASLAPERRVSVLLRRAREATVYGPWRVASPQEWDASAP